MYITKSKKMEAQTAVKVAGQELEEETWQLRMPKTSLRQLRMRKIEKAENDVKSKLKPMSPSKKIRLEKRKDAWSNCRRLFVSRENQVTAQQSLVDVAQNELNQAKAPISNDENVLNQALLEQSQVEQSIRESQNYLATLQASQQNGSDTVAQIEATFN